MTSKHVEKVSIVEEAYDWRLRTLDADITAEEQRAFDAWLHRSPQHAAAYRKAQGVVSAVDRLKPADFAEDVRRPERLESVRRWWHSRGAMSRAWPLGTVAASSLAALVVVFLATQRSPVLEVEELSVPVGSTFSSERGETTTITLDDGSTVTLGAATTLTVTYEPSLRHARLDQGDALFQVAADPLRPFLVRSGDLTVEVVGTTFDVRNNGGVARVAVAEGAVAVRHPVVIANKVSGLVATENLLPGQQIVAMNRKLGDVGAVDPKTVGSWQEGRFEYRRALLSEVVSDLNRYSNVPILLSDPDGQLSDATVTAIFDGQAPEVMVERLPKILPVALDRTDPQRLVIRPGPAASPAR
ncbi:MAG: FecR domain-containing protein [Pseudomonadota bacterium]